MLDNLHDIIIKPHVEHAVGFVEDEIGDAREIYIAHLQVGEEASGSRYHHIGSHF